MINLLKSTVFIALASASVGIHAATFTLHGDLAAYEAAIGGAAPLIQDFESLPDGTDMNAAAFLPGAFATSNFDNLEVFDSIGDHKLFGLDGVIRMAGLATYLFDFTSDLAAVAFDVDGWNPAAPGPAIAQVLFSDGTSTVFEMFQTGAFEDTPVFFGLTTTDAFIRQISWREGPEVSGTGNEEVAFDNFRLSPTLVPLPAAIWLIASGLIGLGIVARPRKTV